MIMELLSIVLLGGFLIQKYVYSNFELLPLLYRLLISMSKQQGKPGGRHIHVNTKLK